MKSYFNLFGLEIHLYSICILIGVVIAYLLITNESKKMKLNNDLISNMIFYGIIIGILGARFYYVIFNLDYYSIYPQEIIKIWHGGLAIHGGIIFGIIFIYYFSKKHKLNFIKTLDILAPAVIIAQSIGRWGNFFNQEAYGSLTTYNFFKKLLIPNFIINNMKINGNYYLPTFLFESIWCFIGFVIMIFIRKNKKNKVGYLTSFYLIYYSFGRFFIESLREDSLLIFNIKTAQLVSIIGIIAGIINFFVSKKKNILYKE